MYLLFYAFSLTFSYFFTNTHKIHQNCKVRVYKIGGKRQQTKTHQQHAQTGQDARRHTGRHTRHQQRSTQEATRKEDRRTQENTRRRKTGSKEDEGTRTREDRTGEEKTREDEGRNKTRQEKEHEGTKTGGTVGGLTVCGG